MRPSSPGAPPQAPAPFVVGVGRSGTTLLRLMLDAHPELAIPPETHFLPELIERAAGGASAAELCDVILAARTWGDFGLGEEELRARLERSEAGAASIARGFYTLYAERHGKPRWGDKTPGYVKAMRAIGGELDEARFIHLIRDGRDVALSRRRRGMGAGKPMTATAELWRKRIEGARRQSRRLGGRYLELRYEDLVSEAEAALHKVCAHCELEFDAAMLAHEQHAGERLAELSGDLRGEGGRLARRGEERLAAHALAARAASEERIGAWRTEMSAADREQFEAVAGSLLADLGYDVA